MIKIHTNQNNISAYHFLSLHIKENIDDYYLENITGRILSSEDIVVKGEKYIIKEKCRGGSSLDQTANSLVITIGSSIIYSIVTILYYNYYITNILFGRYCDNPAYNPPEENPPGNIVKENSKNNKNNLSKSVSAESATPVGNSVTKNNKKGGNPSNPEGEMEEQLENILDNKEDEKGSFKYLMKKYLKSFICHIKDNCYEIVTIDSFPQRKEDVIKNSQTSLGSILSFSIFATFIFMLLAPLFLNSATKISCGKPKASSLIFALIFIFTPLLICKVINKIIGEKLKNYKIAISNILLIIFLIVFMIICKGGLSKTMYAMFPVALLVFIGIKFIPLIPDIIHGLSKFFSNNITNISPPVTDIKPEEARRYTFFYTFFEIAIFSLIGWILYTIAFIGQVTEFCPST
jgi:hypothetical protein